MEGGKRKCFTIDSLLNRPDPIRAKNIASVVRGDVAPGLHSLQHLACISDPCCGTMKRLRTPYHQTSLKRPLPLIYGGSSDGDNTEKTMLERTLVHSRHNHGSLQWQEQLSRIFHHDKRVKQETGNFSGTFTQTECRPVSPPREMGNVCNSGYDPASWISGRYAGYGKVPASLTHDFGAVGEWFSQRVFCGGGDQTVADDDDEIGGENDAGDDECVSRCGISISLQKSNLWREFHKRGTEMIINRHGRRMFPRLSIQVSGLNPEATYNISLRFTKVDGRRFKFVNGEWYSTQILDGHGQESRRYLHPESPKSGGAWMRNIISFSKLKITNNPDSDESKIYLQSMFKYSPHIIVEEVGAGTGADLVSSPKAPGIVVCDVTFPVTSYIAVTAYQNERVTHLKIKNNPFAKAFREPDRDEYRYCHPTPSLLPLTCHHPNDVVGYSSIAAALFSRQYISEKMFISE